MSCSINAVDPLNVVVPANFGIHRLGSPSHSNLTFHLKDGSDILANSIIISLNSPIIDHITTDLSLKSIDVQDFERDAVQCFIEGCYEGKLRKLNNDILREVNKMSRVFNVSWMENKCAEYFDFLVNSIKYPEFNYQELLFIFEEAFYVLSKFDKTDLMDKVITKFRSTQGCSEFFLGKFARRPSLNEKQLDIVIRIAGKDTEILVNCIIDSLEADSSSMGNSCRYLLQNLDLAPCFRRKPALQQRLIQSLDAIANPTADDFRLVLSLFNSVNTKEKCLVEVPNLFNSFEKINNFTNFDDLVKFLSTSKDVTSLYMFIDGLICWLFDRKESSISSHFNHAIISLKEKRKWSAVSKDYVENLPRDEGTVPLLRLIKQKSSNIVAMEGNLLLTSSLECKLDDFLFQARNIEFISDSQTTVSTKHCSKKNQGRCGLLAKLSPCSPGDGSMFNIQFVVNPDEYPSHIHYCTDLFSIENVFFALKCFRPTQNRWRYFPVSWSGKPECGADKSIWRWGANCFADSSDRIAGNFPPLFRRHWLLTGNVKIRPELFVKIND